jgi:hypothetical protein
MSPLLMHDNIAAGDCSRPGEHDAVVGRGDRNGNRIQARSRAAAVVPVTVMSGVVVLMNCTADAESRKLSANVLPLPPMLTLNASVARAPSFRK